MRNALITVTITNIAGDQAIRRFSLFGVHAERMGETSALDALLQVYGAVYLDEITKSSPRPVSVPASFFGQAKIVEGSHSMSGSINSRKVSADEILVVSALRNLVERSSKEGDHIKVTVQVF